MQQFRQKYLNLPRPAALGLLLLAVACARTPSSPSVSLAIAPAAVAPAPALPPLPVMGGDAAFQAFIREFETTAVAAGITPDTYNRAVAGITPVPAIQTVIDNQPEFAKQVWSYLDGTVSARRCQILVDLGMTMRLRFTCPRARAARPSCCSPISASS